MSNTREPGAVLLTGATGSLGGYICADLLLHTTATIYTLHRGAPHRLTTRLSDVGVPPNERVIPVAGDITAPLIGLSAAAFDALAESIDEIIHCAAHVNLADGYEQLAPTNVQGTRHMIALSERAGRLTGRPVPIRFVSTLGTLSAARATGLTDVDERTLSTPETAGPLGYPRTKVTAEADLHRAGDLGIPVTIFRPGTVTGHSRTGRTTDSDLVVPLLRAAIRTGCAPAEAGAAPIDAVDVVARSLVALAHHPHAAGQTYHLIHPEPLPVNDFFQALRRAGHELTPVTEEEWWRRIDQHTADPEVRPLAAMRDLFRYTLITGDGYHVPHISSDLTWKTLTDLGQERPPLDGCYLDRLVGALTTANRLPPARLA